MSEIAPDFIIKYSGRELYGRLYKNVLRKLEIHKHQITSWVLGGEIYIEYLDLVNAFEDFKKPNQLEEIYYQLERVEKMFNPILGLSKATLKQKVAVGIMQSTLNAWRLQLCEVKEEYNILSGYEKLECISMCQNEDLLRFSETLIYKFLKQISQQL